MLIRRRRGWELRESAATPEAVFLGRRAMIKAIAAGPDPGAGIALGPCGDEEDPSAALYPAKRNPRYTLDRPLTDEKLATTYNNFYEFGSQKSIASDAQALKIRPWTVKIDGLVEKPLTVDIDELLKKMPLEERLYRHRCVEAWSMAVPWSGFPMAALVDFAKPLGSAKYVQMETFLDPKIAPGQKEVWYPWPYVEGVTIAEAGNELAFLVTGHVRQAGSKAGRGAAAAGIAVEIRVQIGQVDRPLLVHRKAAGVVLGNRAGQRVRVLGERQPRSSSSALEPGDGAGARHQRARADAQMERLRRVRGPSL